MYFIFIIILFCIISFFVEKSDYYRMKDAEKLPPFTKKEAEKYYNETYTQSSE